MILRKSDDKCDAKSISQYGYQKKIKAIFFYIVLCTVVLLTGYFQFFLKLSYVISNVLSILITVFACSCLIRKKYICLSFNRVSAIDVLIILFGFFLLMLRLPFGDSAGWDTLNYHIYAQQSLGDNFVTNSFFPGRAINSMCWILGDQIHYFFRFWLGYRVGTVATFLVFILMYFQVKDLIGKLLISLNVNCNELYVAVIALGCIMADNILWSLNLYYVDVFAVPLLLELLNIVLFSESQSKGDVIFTAYIAGLIVSLKISNAFILLVLGIIYIFKFRKNLNIQIILFSMVIAVFPIGVYVAWSIQLTGNPIFPYANSIFKSDYFTTVQSVNDLAGFPLRFGPENWLQFIFWPIYCMFQKTRITDQGAYSGRLLCALGGMLLYVVSKKRIKYSNELKMCVCIVIAFYLEYLTVYEGYIRYMIILEIIAAIVSGVVIVAVMRGSSQVGKILGILVAACFSMQICVGLNEYVFDKNEIALRPTFFTDFDGYLKNLKYVLKDKEKGIDKETLDSVDVWLATDYDNAYGAILDETKPIINIIPTCTVTNEEAEQIYTQLIEQLKNKNVYVVGNINTIDTQIDNLNNAGFIVESVKNITPYFYDANNGMLLLKVQLNNNKETVVIYGWNGESIYPIPYSNKQGTIIVGSDASTRNDKDSVGVIEVWVKNLNTQEDYCLEKIETDYNDQYITISYSIQDEEWNETTCIVVSCCDRNGNPKAVREFVNEVK